MTGFDETVPTELDPDQDATAAEEITANKTPPATERTSWDDDGDGLESQAGGDNA